MIKVNETIKVSETMEWEGVNFILCRAKNSGFSVFVFN